MKNKRRRNKFAYRLYSQTNWSEQIKSIRNELSTLGTDPFLQRYLLCMILQFTNGFSGSRIETCDDNFEAVVMALNDQIKIGIGNLLQGLV